MLWSRRERSLRKAKRYSFDFEILYKWLFGDNPQFAHFGRN